MTCSRTFAVALAAGLTVVSPAVLSAQTRSPRVTVSVLTTREHVSIENGEGTIAGHGAAVSLRAARFVSLEGQVSKGYGEVIDRDRFAKAGVGVGFGVSLHTPLDRRVAGRLSLGLGMRRFDHVDLVTDERYTRDRGGPSIALGAPIVITPRLAIEPEARWLFTVADELFMSRSFGLKAGWRF